MDGHSFRSIRSRPITPREGAMLIDLQRFPIHQFQQQLGIDNGRPFTVPQVRELVDVFAIYDAYRRAKSGGYYNVARWYDDNFRDLVTYTSQIKNSQNQLLYPFMQNVLHDHGFEDLTKDALSRDTDFAQ
jgi:hypothetical protein